MTTNCSRICLSSPNIFLVNCQVFEHLCCFFKYIPNLPCRFLTFTTEGRHCITASEWVKKMWELLPLVLRTSLSHYLGPIVCTLKQLVKRAGCQLMDKPYFCNTWCREKRLCCSWRCNPRLCQNCCPPTFFQQIPNGLECSHFYMKTFWNHNVLIFSKGFRPLPLNLFCNSKQRLVNSDKSNLVWSQEESLTFCITCFMVATESACTGRRGNKADILGYTKSKPRFLRMVCRPCNWCPALHRFSNTDMIKPLKFNV